MATEDLGTINIEVDEDSADAAAESLQGDGGSGGGGRVAGRVAAGTAVGDKLGGIVGMLGGMSSALTAIVGILGAALGVLLMLEPMQQMLSGLLELAKAFLAPLAMMLMTLFEPVLRGLVTLLPAWYAFIENFQSLIQSPLMLLLTPLLGMFVALAALKTMFPQQFKALKTKVQSAMEWLWGQLQAGVSFIMELPGKIANKLANVIPGAGDVASGAADAGGDLLSGAGDLIGGAAQSVRQTLDVNVSGYNDEQIMQTLGKVFGMRGQ
jgi:phage-related protein